MLRIVLQLVVEEEKKSKQGSAPTAPRPMHVQVCRLFRGKFFNCVQSMNCELKLVSHLCTVISNLFGGTLVLGRRGIERSRVYTWLAQQHSVHVN